MLLGPTAAGKTAAALAIARSVPVEIVSVDSALVYRGMDIGTAKPTREERAEVPHHLIDILDPAQSYSAARFAADARALIDAIRARGRTPLLVGGTMLYARALTEGLHELPDADPSLRARLDAEAAAQGWPALHARLSQLDPRSAARIEPGDAQRIQRALELIELTGRPMSALLDARREVADIGRVILVALEPSDRAVLHRRIDERLTEMFEAGFTDEVRALRARGDLHAAMPSMRCVGYRQVWEHLDGRYDAATTIARAGAATRQLAKRQLTWLRSMPSRVVVDCIARDAARQVSRIVEEQS
jgi:tRNA dimethylallyltransferase